MSKQISDRLVSVGAPRHVPLMFYRPRAGDTTLAAALPFDLLLIGDASDLPGPPDTPVFLSRDNLSEVVNKFVKQRHADSPPSRFWWNVDHLLRNIEFSTYLRIAVAHMPQAELAGELVNSPSLSDTRLYRLLASNPWGYGLVVSDYCIEDSNQVGMAMPAFAKVCMGFACSALVMAHPTQPFPNQWLTNPEAAAFLCTVPPRLSSDAPFLPTFEIALTLADAYEGRCAIPGSKCETLPPTLYSSWHEHSSLSNFRCILLFAALVRIIVEMIRDRHDAPEAARDAICEWLSALTSENVFVPDDWHYDYRPLRAFACSLQMLPDAMINLSLAVQLRIMPESRSKIAGTLSFSPSRNVPEFLIDVTKCI
jgi:hypothetical protein